MARLGPRTGRQVASSLARELARESHHPLVHPLHSGHIRTGWLGGKPAGALLERSALRSRCLNEAVWNSWKWLVFPFHRGVLFDCPSEPRSSQIAHGHEEDLVVWISIRGWHTPEKTLPHSLTTCYSLLFLVTTLGFRRGGATYSQHTYEPYHCLGTLGGGHVPL